METYGVTLFGLCGGMIKQSSAECDGFLSSDVLKRVIETVNKVDVGEYRSHSNAKIEKNKVFRKTTCVLYGKS